jgi:hypothetical protein
MTRQDAENKKNGTSWQHDRLDQVFWSEIEADKFALQDAMRWIDENSRLQN